MVNRFYGLRHDGIVGRYDDNGHVSDFGATCPHGCKGLVSGGIKKCYQAAVFQQYTVGPDMLRYTSRLSGNHIGIANMVQQGCFSVVNVSHNGHHGRPGFFFHFSVQIFVPFQNVRAVLIFKAEWYFELIADHFQRIAVQTLVYRDQLAHGEKLADDLSR